MTRIKQSRDPDLVLDGIPFWADPRVNYPFDYIEIFENVAAGFFPKKDALRKLLQEDPWFMAYFVLGWRGANHPFVVNLAKELIDSPDDYRLLLAARGHGKTTIDTIASTLCDICKNPNNTTGLFSFTRDASRAILGVIKRTSETSSLLKSTFPDIFWQNPERESPVWNNDMLLFKRQTNEIEMTLEAWGLERLPTGKHFKVLKFDDIVTASLVQNPEVMLKTIHYFDMALECVSENHRHTVTGTYYDHRDVLNTLTNRGTYHIIKKPATHDGTKDGVPVFLSKKVWGQKLKGSLRVLNTQQLLNATPTSDRILVKENVRRIRYDQLPKTLYRVIVVDPAGTKEQQVQDYWAILCLGFDPRLSLEGHWNCFLLDACIKKIGYSEGMNEIARMFQKNLPIHKVGIEKVGMSSYEIHLQNLLKAKGYNYTLKNERVVCLTPKSKNKEFRIEAAMAYPLNNTRIYFTDRVPEEECDKLYSEMDDFPFGHADGLDAFAYGLELANHVNMRKAMSSKSDGDSWSRREEAAKHEVKDGWRYV